jgi:hypothetical protein
LLAHGLWFSLGTPASSTTKTGRHDITEILLKVALNTKNQSKSNRKTAIYMIFISDPLNQKWMIIMLTSAIQIFKMI